MKGSTKSTTEASSLLGSTSSDGALEEGGAINIYDLRHIGYLAQYFAVGMIQGGLPATHYGFFVAYLNVPAYVSSAAGALTQMPWSFKIFFALLMDACPIGGYRRRPYMVIGWSLAAVFLILLWSMPLPTSYYCIDELVGAYNTTLVCNETASSAGMPFALMMMMVAVGYLMADVAADALTVTYARREPASQRGKTQTMAYLVRECGMITSQLLIGFGMNGPEYNGTFSTGLSFNAICACLSVPAIAMVPISWYFIEEPKVGAPKAAVTLGNKGTPFESLKGAAPRGDAEGGGVGGEAGGEDEQVWTLRAYFASAMTLLKSGAMFELILFYFLSNSIGGIGTTAGAEIQRYWADVQNLQNQLFAIAGHFLFVLGLWLVRSRYLEVSWRYMIAGTLIFSNLVDMPFTFCTIFNVVRNQYFFLDDGLITAIPAAMNFVVSTYVMVEMAEPGTEGITYGILTTASNIGGPVSSGISNWLFSHFHPSLSLASNYVEDLPSFRNLVAISYAISYFFSFVALALLPLLPDQKADTQVRKASRPSSISFAIGTIAILSVASLYSIVINLLTVFPATSCLEIAGGDGCSEPPLAGW